MKHEFYLFRHGETDWNKQGKMQGSADIPLNALGLKQAEALREFFDSFAKSEDADLSFSMERDLVSSDLTRALQTAAIAFRLEAHDLIRRDPRFRETHLGKAEGLNREELVAQFGEETWNQWIGLGETSWGARFPDGESKAEVRDRAKAALFDLASEQLRAPNENDALILRGRRVAVATHGGLVRRLLHSLLPDEKKPIDVVNGSVFRFTLENGILRADREPIFVP
jgi:2,3-bisphosphoglycerate-dependent phosphoglycerate mutase